MGTEATRGRGDRDSQNLRPCVSPSPCRRVPASPLPSPLLWFVNPGAGIGVVKDIVATAAEAAGDQHTPVVQQGCRRVVTPDGDATGPGAEAARRRIVNLDAPAAAGNQHFAARQ